MHPVWDQGMYSGHLNSPVHPRLWPKDGCDSWVNEKKFNKGNSVILLQQLLHVSLANSLESSLLKKKYSH